MWPWRALNYQIADDHYFRWGYSGATTTDKLARFTASAEGDLDCDGTFSSYQIRGTVDAEFGVKVAGPIVDNEIE